MSTLIKCPNCDSFEVRRSALSSRDVPAKPVLRSPYRCRNCGERFWVVSKSAFYVAGLAGGAIIAGAVAWGVVGASRQGVQVPSQTTAISSTFTEATKLAKNNDPDAEYRLAHMYASGNGVDGNKKQSLVWLERAAEHGSVDAQFEFGNALREGSGVVQDYERAAKWLQLAAEHGNADAQYALGQMYRAGIGLPPDNARAYMWFNLAAAQEFVGAAAQRDLVLRLLTPGQVVEAQVEARRFSDAPIKQRSIAP
jgi:uncharacterized protein